MLLLNLPGSEIDGWHQPPLACHNAVYTPCHVLQYSVALCLKSRTFTFLLILYNFEEVFVVARRKIQLRIFSLKKLLIQILLTG